MVRSLLFIFLLLLISCESPTDDEIDCSTISEGKIVELITPTGGESLKIGDKVPVKWKVNTELLQSQVALKISINGSSGPWLHVFDKGIKVPATEESGIVCMDTVWTIGQENEALNYGNSQTVLVRVENYFDSGMYDVSGMITVSE
jgi:hypothetical protein